MNISMKGNIFVKQTLNLIVYTAAACALTSCGGGGGGGGFVGAADTALMVTPNKLDTGDNASVAVEIAEVHSGGISLKLRYPKEASYVPDSAFLLVDSNKKNVTPTVNTVVDEDTYLVFYLSDTWFGKGKSGTLELEIEGKQEVSKSTVEVDADVDDPQIANDVEFDSQNPEFSAQDSVNFEVQG